MMRMIGGIPATAVAGHDTAIGPERAPEDLSKRPLTGTRSAHPSRGWPPIRGHAFERAVGSLHQARDEEVRRAHQQAVAAAARVQRGEDLWKDHLQDRVESS